MLILSKKTIVIKSDVNKVDSSFILKLFTENERQNENKLPHRVPLFS